jgi:EAL domain-containing protein (putative c-di-GMP-specific phosphodiesterase class I)
MGGAWIARADDGEYGVRATESGLTGFAYSPITDADGVLTGLVVIGTLDPDWEARQADLLVMVQEFGVTARTLLGSILVDRGRMDRTRAAIARIIATRAFSPVFQPVVDLQSGAPIGYEALTRFADGRPPDATFAEAHVVKMGFELELATLRGALDAASGLPRDAWLSVNVSPRLLLADDRLLDLVVCAGRRIVVEITEHERIDDYAALRAALARLGPGVRVAVDDAGAGVANFNHIVELRPDYVKIDVGLIRDLDADLARQAAVVSLVHFARASDRWTIAEGVETEAERATLERLGVPFAQGYLFSRPRSIEDIGMSQPSSPVDQAERNDLRAEPAA